MTDPINMLLWCPQCNAQHIDAPSEGWNNPPHRSHLCHECGCIWRPADVATNGVAEVKTAGDADTWGWIGGYSLLPPLGRRLSDALASLEIAERDRHDLLHALGWKTGPFTDGGTRQVVMDDTAGLRPEMVKARRRAQEAEGSAMMWHMIAGERVENAQSGLLLRIWRQLREEQQARRLAESRLAKAQVPFQGRVQPWMIDCFDAKIAGDKLERSDRAVEEMLELSQAVCALIGVDFAPRAHALVDYVAGRPVGEIPQEVGGVMVTLAALCLAVGADMHDAGEAELDRINQPNIIEKIRAKQAAKPTGSALPIASPKPAPHPDTARLDALRDECWDLRSFAVPTGGDDADVAWRVVGHWMAEPHERTIAEGWSDDPRVAIDAAIAGPMRDADA